MDSLSFANTGSSTSNSVNGVVTTKERKRLHRWEQKNRWMPHYELKYGVVPIEYGPPPSNAAFEAAGLGALVNTNNIASTTVIKAKCMFCECFGREVVPNQQTSIPSTSITTLEFPVDASASVVGMDTSLVTSHQGNGLSNSEAPPAKRRKKRQTMKVFGPNFRTDNLECHLNREHPARWKEYERLRDVDKKSFFPVGDEEEKEALGINQQQQLLRMQLHVNATANAATDAIMAHRVADTNGEGSPSISMSIDTTTISSIRRPLLIEDGVKHMVGLELMHLVESMLSGKSDGNDISKCETQSVGVTGEWKPMDALGFITIKNEHMFRYIIDAFRANLSVEMVVALVHATHRLVNVEDTSSIDILQRVTQMDVVNAMHQMVAMNLFTIAQLVSSTWGYTLQLHFKSTGVVELRVQISSIKDELYNVHIASIPFTSLSLEGLGMRIIKILMTLSANAVEKVIGVFIDGDPYHMQAFKTIGTWLRKHISSSCSFYVCFSPAYHLSHLVENILEQCQVSFSFETTLVEIDALCRAHVDLFTAMSPAPSPHQKLTAHWVSLYHTCEWLAIHRETILKWLLDHPDHSKFVPPSQLWWALLYVFRDLLKDLYMTYTKLHLSCTLFRHVQKQLQDLIFQLRLKYNIKPTALPEAIESTSNPNGDKKMIIIHEFGYQDFVNAVIPLDMFMYDAFQLKTVESIHDTARIALYQHIHSILQTLFTNILAMSTTSISATSEMALDSVSHSYIMQIPPTTPHDFVAMDNLAFMELLNSHRDRIRAKWPGTLLTIITNDRNRMVSTFKQQDVLYDVVMASVKAQETGEGSFQEAWKPLMDEYASLHGYALVLSGLCAPMDYTFMMDSMNDAVQRDTWVHATQYDKLEHVRQHIQSDNVNV